MHTAKNLCSLQKAERERERQKERERERESEKERVHVHIFKCFIFVFLNLPTDKPVPHKPCIKHTESTNLSTTYRPKYILPYLLAIRYPTRKLSIPVLSLDDPN